MLKKTPPKTSTVESSKSYAMFCRNRSHASLTDVEAEEQKHSVLIENPNQNVELCFWEKE